MTATADEHQAQREDERQAQREALYLALYRERFGRAPREVRWSR